MEPRALFAIPDGIEVTLQSATASGVGGRQDTRQDAAKPAAGASGESVGLGIDELRLQGLAIGWRQRASAGPAVSGAPRSSQPAGSWHLGALAELSGELSVHVADAAWVLDADVRLPIKAGGIDFNRATVSHIGPDSSMGLSRMGLYVDAPTGRQYLAMLAATHVDGARFEQRGALLGSLVTDRGALALAPLLQALLDGVRPFTPAAGAEALLRRTRIEGQLRLGDGPLGRRGHGLVLTGAAAGRNRLELASADGGGWLLRWPELSAEALHWPLPASGTGAAGSLSGSLSVTCVPEPGGSARVTLRAPELMLRKLRLQPAAARAAASGPGDTA